MTPAKATARALMGTAADFSPLTVSALCAALHASGVTLTASREGLSASPRSGVTADMAEAIRAHKAALVRALERLGPVTPYPCSYCALDFVSIDGQHCGTCAALVGHPLRVVPDSTEERLVLRALEHRAGVIAERSQLAQPSRPRLEQLEQSSGTSMRDSSRKAGFQPSHHV